LRAGLLTFLDRVIGKDVELKIVTVPLDAIKADPTQIEQVIMNLCINARDAMPTGGRLLIETEMVDLDEAYCRFYPHVAPGRYAVISSVRYGNGDGCGNKGKNIRAILYDQRAGKRDGNGLATVYGIVKQHGGFTHGLQPSRGRGVYSASICARPRKERHRRSRRPRQEARPRT